MANRVGQRFGDYHLHRFLGEGTFGDVYLGEHLYKKTPAAIKVFKTTLTPDKLKDFLTEVRTVLLRHPNIVPILDFGIDESDLPFLVMEYAPNGTLGQRHPKGIPLPLTTIIPYVKQLAAALQYAHDERRIHRDVKPENMLFGANNQLLLSDFGIAVVAHNPSSQRTEDSIGTARYMAPEQWQGKPLPATDQYAVGIIVYEWLCGESPFAGGTLQMMYQHIHVPPSPFKKDRNIPPQVEQAVMKALAKDPKQRFATVQAFAIALEQASMGRSGLVPSSGGGGGDVGWGPLRSLVVEAHAQAPHISSPPPTPISPPVPSITSVDFPMFGYDLARTRFNPHERILSPTNVSRLVPLWSAPTGGSINSSPAVANEVLYVGSYDKKLYAFEAGTGKPLWSAPTGAAIYSSPAVANGVVYVGSLDHKLYAFEAGTGKPLWSAPTGAAIYSSPAVANGVVYVGSEDFKLYAFEAGTGKPLWSAPTDAAISSSLIVSSPAAANGVVYVGSDDKKLYAFDAGTGTPLWSAPTGAAIYSSPAVANGVVYVGSLDHKLYAFEAGTGKPLWSAAAGDRIFSSPAVANGVVYVGSDDKKLYAFKAGTGKRLWSKPLWSAATGGSIRSSPAVANGVVYIGSLDHKLYAFHLP